MHKCGLLDRVLSYSMHFVTIFTASSVGMHVNVEVTS